MANIPVNRHAYFLQPGASVVGNFAGALALQTGSLASLTSSVNIDGMNYIVGRNPDGSDVTGSFPNSFSLSSGTKLELQIVSCSLAANSAPLLLYI